MRLQACVTWERLACFSLPPSVNSERECSHPCRLRLKPISCSSTEKLRFRWVCLCPWYVHLSASLTQGVQRPSTTLTSSFLIWYVLCLPVYLSIPSPLISPNLNDPSSKTTLQPFHALFPDAPADRGDPHPWGEADGAAQAAAQPLVLLLPRTQGESGKALWGYHTGRLCLSSL